MLLQDLKNQNPELKRKKEGKNETKDRKKIAKKYLSSSPTLQTYKSLRMCRMMVKRNPKESEMVKGIEMKKEAKKIKMRMMEMTIKNTSQKQRILIKQLHLKPSKHTLSNQPNQPIRIEQIFANIAKMDSNIQN